MAAALKAAGRAMLLRQDKAGYISAVQSCVAHREEASAAAYLFMATSVSLSCRTTQLAIMARSRVFAIARPTSPALHRPEMGGCFTCMSGKQGCHKLVVTE